MSFVPPRVQTRVQTRTSPGSTAPDKSASEGSVADAQRAGVPETYRSVRGPLSVGSKCGERVPAGQSRALSVARPVAQAPERLTGRSCIEDRCKTASTVGYGKGARSSVATEQSRAGETPEALGKVLAPGIAGSVRSWFGVSLVKRLQQVVGDPEVPLHEPDEGKVLGTRERRAMHHQRHRDLRAADRWCVARCCHAEQVEANQLPQGLAQLAPGTDAIDSGRPRQLRSASPKCCARRAETARAARPRDRFARRGVHEQFSRGDAHVVFRVDPQWVPRRPWACRAFRSSEAISLPRTRRRAGGARRVTAVPKRIG